MPNHWKILSKNFLLNIFFFTVFFISISIFFKLTRLIKYFILGADFFDLTLTLTLFLATCLPIVISSTCFISAYIVTSKIHRNSGLKAFQALGLNPANLFTPVIFIAVMLSVMNLSINVILTPALNKKLSSVLKNKKEETNVLGTYGRKFNKQDRYLSMTTNQNTREATDFLIIPGGDSFTWFMSETIKENEDDLTFTGSSLFRVSPEEEGFNTIAISQNSSMVIPKKSIYSVIPFFSINIDSVDYTNDTILAVILFSFYPVILTILGALIALKIYPFFFCIMFISNITMLVLSTMLTSPLLNFFSILSLGVIFPLYFLSLYKFKRGIS